MTCVADSIIAYIPEAVNQVVPWSGTWGTGLWARKRLAVISSSQPVPGLRLRPMQRKSGGGLFSLGFYAIL